MTALQYLTAANWCLSLGTLVCFLTLVAQMFMHGESGMGATSLVFCLCCGIGVLVAFFYGWSKANEWENTPLMLTWSLFFVLGVLTRLVLYSAAHSLAAF